MIPITRRASHSTRCTPFLCAHALVEDLPHTDPADLTDFVVGGKSHRGCGGVAHTDSTDLTDFVVGGKSHRGWWSGSDFVVGGKSHRGWWSGWLYGLSDYSEFSECSERSEYSIFSFY